MPSSARAGVYVGPTVHVPVDMSSRIVTLLFDDGLADVKPPTTYRYWPTVVYPARKNPTGAGAPVVQLFVATV